MLLLKVIIIKLCVDSLGLCPNKITDEVKVQSASDKNDTIEMVAHIRPIGNENPRVTKTDTTALAIVDGKIVPFMDAIRSCFYEGKTKVSNQYDPFDAIFELGMIGFKGAVVFSTKKK